MNRRLEIAAVADLDALGAEWRALEAKAEAGFFLSWTWIGTWARSLETPPHLLRIWQDDKTIALGLMAARTVRRHGFVTSRQLLLHEAGDRDLDRLAIEYNGLLAVEEAPDLLPFVLAELQKSVAWDECVLPALDSRELKPLAASGLGLDIYRQSPCYALDLGALRSQGLGLLDCLSRNARAQLRRARRLAEKEGELRLEAAGDVGQALAWFDAMIRLDRRADGAFATQKRADFHRRLIGEAIPRGEVEILEARAGGNLLGYLYQFCHRGRVSAYQAAYPVAADNRRHPGLVLHLLAIERALARGQALYDFLAGEARYKSSLGQLSTRLVWLRAQKPRLAFAVERNLGRLVRTLRRGLLISTRP